MARYKILSEAKTIYHHLVEAATYEDAERHVREDIEKEQPKEATIVVGLDAREVE